MSRISCWRVVRFLLFGLIPAINAGRTDISQALTGGGSRSTTSRGQNRIRGALVIAELATALVLLTGAGVLTKSFAHLTSIDSGIQPKHVLVVNFSLSRTRYPDATAGQFFLRRSLIESRPFPACARSRWPMPRRCPGFE